MYKILFWSYRSAVQNRIRSILVVLATALAAVCVSLSCAILAGLNGEFVRFVDETGAFDVVTVSANQASPDYVFAGPLTEDDGASIVGEPACDCIGSELVWWQFPLSTDVRATRQILAGATPDTIRALHHDVISGRSLTDLDNQTAARVIVLGQKALKALFPNTVDVLGKQVRISNIDFVVVGVLRKYAYYDGNDPTEMPYKNGYNFIPLSTSQEVVNNGDRHVSYIQARVKTGYTISQLKSQIARRLFLRHRHVETYFINGNDAQARQWQQTQRSMWIGLILLSTTSLIIGGTCAANAQLASVIERTREFGIRRSIGASRLSVVKLVIAETLIVCFTGALVGVLSGLAVVPAVKAILPNGIPGSPTVVWWSIPLSLVTTTAMGIVAGLWPAIRAARLDPLSAIRIT